MQKFHIVLIAVVLGLCGWSLPGAAAGQLQGHGHADHGSAATDGTSCRVHVHITEEAERQVGGALYTGPKIMQHSGHSPATPEMDGAHMKHETQRGGSFFMAPNKVHHLEGVYSDECGFQLFLFNAFTKPIHVDRFQAFVHVFPESDDEFDFIRFLSPSSDATVLTTEFGHAVSRPFQIELYVKFPESLEPQLFNITVAAANQ